MEIVIKFLFLGIWVYCSVLDSVSAMDSLLSPKGVNYEGKVKVLAGNFKIFCEKGFNFFQFCFSL